MTSTIFKCPLNENSCHTKRLSFSQLAVLVRQIHCEKETLLRWNHYFSEATFKCDYTFWSPRPSKNDKKNLMVTQELYTKIMPLSYHAKSVSNSTGCHHSLRDLTILHQKASKNIFNFRSMKIELVKGASTFKKSKSCILEM